MCEHSLSSITDEADDTLVAVVTLVAVGRGAELFHVGQPRPLLSKNTLDDVANSVAYVCTSMVCLVIWVGYHSLL